MVCYIRLLFPSWLQYFSVRLQMSCFIYVFKYKYVTESLSGFPSILNETTFSSFPILLKFIICCSVVMSTPLNTRLCVYIFHD
jgi:hypothetical protein